MYKNLNKCRKFREFCKIISIQNESNFTYLYDKKEVLDTNATL